MQVNREVEIAGATYESQPETCEGSCKGCIAKENQSLCSDISDEVGCQYSDGLIWIKKEKPMEIVKQIEEPKYTVEEVLTAVEQVTDEYFTDYQTNKIKEVLTKQENAKYKLYLELKAKFGE